MKKKLFRWVLIQIFVVIAALLFLFSAYVYHINGEVVKRFEGNRWEVPSRVYAQPLELYEGKSLSPAQFEQTLSLLRYNKSKSRKAGTYYRVRNKFYVHTRPFKFWDESIPAIQMEISFHRDKILTLKNRRSSEPLDLWRLEPLFIGGIYPKLNEDRVLVRLQDVPESLVKTLLAVEDRNFYTHTGVAPLSIVRALLANIRAGARVQGGSTLTQQLVKNFFLTNEKTLVRKMKEAIMSMLLEWHYSKDEILEAYINEIYLGQDGNRAIHGFGLGAQFYFDAPLNSLSNSQIALLVGLVKGASFYNPRRFPDRATKRRNVVLTVQEKAGLLGEKKAAELAQLPLEVSSDKPSGITRYPAFIDLVKRQLKEDYRPEDLSRAGLRLFTTIDPLVQFEVERSVSLQLPKLERKAGLTKNQLETAAIITDAGTGAVRALVGSRNFRSQGFNRALDAKRHIGSLIKPAVYLTALEQPRKYSLSTILEDSPISVHLENGKTWRPENYDNQFNGRVSLISALANSYNAATVRLGMGLGLSKISDTIQSLGIDRQISLYPSMLLGAVDMSTFEVLKMYQTFSAQGFQTPVRAIHTVTTADGKILNRYPLQIKQTVKAESIYLLNTALKTAARKGTGRGMYRQLAKKFSVAGKTGTTNDYRDSWFAGMTGDKVAVVWIGADDNQPVNLTGASGALKLWTDIIARTSSRSLELPIAERISFAKMSAILHEKRKVICRENLLLPYVAGYKPDSSLDFNCSDED